MRNYKTLFFAIYFLISFCAFAQNKTIDSLLFLLPNATHDTSKINILHNLSLSYDKIDRFKAFDYAKQALTLSQKIGDNKSTGKLFNHLGDLYWFSGDYKMASDNYHDALKIFETLGDKVEIARCYRNIGWIYQGQKDYKKTLEYYEKALKINTDLGLKRRVLITYDDFAILYKLMKNYTAALEYAKKNIQMSEEIKDERAIGSAYANIAFIYYEIGEYEQAIDYFNKSKNLLQKHNDYYNLAEGYNGLANCYYSKNDIDKAINYLEQAAAIAEKNNYVFVKTAAYERLAKAHYAKEDYKIAFDYLKSFQRIYDSAYSENNNRLITEMNAKYEFEKNELRINSLEKEKAQEKEFRVYLIAFCVLVIGLAFFLYRGNIQKKKANKKLSYAYEQIEIKNKDITDSINYSKRIQEAMLPPLDNFKTLFDDAFIFYKPKDIVSGDFYWFTEEDGKKIVAACDCTGHGVPGALMSMIGNNFLNKIVKEKGITAPDDILYDLNKEVVKSLNQSKAIEAHDGMDIALISLSSENELDYAGANRPLWIIRNKNGDKHIEEIKPTKKSLGGSFLENKQFAATNLLLSKGDSVYIFTDGFADQFGGTDGKKFMTKNLKKIFLEICAKPASEQKNILNKIFHEWKGSLEQVDDVLVIGIKV